MNTNFTGDAEYKKIKRTKLRMTNVDTLRRFYQICSELNIADDDIETKERILDELAKHYKVTVWETDRTEQEIVKDLNRHYRHILWVKIKNFLTGRGNE